jgi:DNA polymerase I
MYWIFDIYAGVNGTIIGLLDENGRLETRRLDIEFPAHILPKDIDASKICEMITEHPDITECTTTKGYLPPSYTSKTRLVKLRSRSLKDIKYVVRRVTELNLGTAVNKYPHPLIQALWESKRPPCTYVDNNLNIIDDLDNVSYSPPPINVLKLELQDWAGVLTNPSDIPTEFKAYYNNELVESGPLNHLNHIKYYINKSHILIFTGGFLSALNVEPTLDNIPIKVYTGDMLVGVHGLIEWCRISWTPLHMVVGAPIGKILTSIEALRALERKYVIFDAPVNLERFRAIEDIPLDDRGGIISEPKIGVFFNVAQLDFNSLYPSIIAKYNISSETVNTNTCKKQINTPYFGHKICLDRRGIVSEVIEKLVRRRDIIKKEINAINNKDLREILDERQKAIKWILVASFGYLGYRNAKFGKIEAYESVVAFARKIAEKAVKISKSLGFDVIHILVDSLFVSKRDAMPEDYQDLANKISASVGIGMKIEAIYDWIVFPPTKDGKGSPMRYYGRLRGGGIKVKGIEAVQFSQPPIVKKAQLDAIKILATVATEEQFKSMLPRALEKYESYIIAVKKGDVLPEDLVIRKRLRQESYITNQPHVKAAKMLGRDITIVRYIVGTEPYPVEFGFLGYNKDYYANALERAKLPITFLI